jgi:hypothetical protein
MYGIMEYMDTHKEIRSHEPHPIEDAAQFAQPDITEQLADAGIEATSDHPHLANIHSEIAEIHGAQSEGIDSRPVENYAPDQASEQQVGTIPVTAGESVNTAENPVQPPYSDNTPPIDTSISMPFFYLIDRIKQGFVSYLTKHGSASNPIFNGHADVSQVPKKPNLVTKSTDTSIPENVVQFPTQPATSNSMNETSSVSPDNIRELPTLREEVQDAA